MSMIQQARRYNVQLAVIGSGLAGFAASIFALERKISTAQVGNTGAIAYTTGYFDLLGAHPVESRQALSDPWAGLDALRKDEPSHPYARISNREIRNAITLFVQSISDMGVGYTQPGETNLNALTPAGTTKPTLSVPRSMAPGIDARNENARTLIIDFLGLKGFSAREVVANLKSTWPNLSAARIEFPEMEGGVQLYPEVMARALEVPAHRAQLAERINAVAGNADYIGLPAIMGVHCPDKVHAELKRLIGIKLFEIPTMPPGVAGIRLREMFEQLFPDRGLILVPQQNVETLTLNADGGILNLQDSYGEVIINAETVIIATGRFLSGGLAAERDGVRETLLDLPVVQPSTRDEWYRQQYFDPRGHQINRAGVEVDDLFRPLGRDGKPTSKRLFCTGALLAHQDWMRQRCGAGVAIASAYKAVETASAWLTEAAV